MNNTEEKNEPWVKLISRLCYIRRPENRQNYRKEIASIAKGASPYTETWAYPYVLMYGEPQRDPTALLRAAAIMAEFVDVPQTEKPTPFGRSLKNASLSLARKSGKSHPLDPDTPDAIASRLAFIDTLDVEEAASTLRQIMSIVRKTNTPVDFYSLTRLLLRWGNGFSKESSYVRKSLLRDYYG